MSEERPDVILLAEDDEETRDLLRINLTIAGYDVLEAQDGREAMEVCLHDHPDLLLLDVKLPDRDGFEVLDEVKSNAATSDIPVLFLTADSSSDSVVKALDKGADDYVAKTVGSVELTARVQAALRTKRLQDKLRESNALLDAVSRTDVTTGLYNRRHLEERINELGAGVSRYSRSIGLVLVDIDCFKKVNDTHGHEMGDEVLKRVAKSIANTVRSTDTVGRWGGEEFLVIMSYADTQAANSLGERIRAAVEKASCVAADGSQVCVTVSVGCSSGATDPARLLKSADVALYEAKAQGRNRVVMVPTV